MEVGRERKREQERNERDKAGKDGRMICMHGGKPQEKKVRIRCEEGMKGGGIIIREKVGKTQGNKGKESNTRRREEGKSELRRNGGKVEIKYSFKNHATS